MTRSDGRIENWSIGGTDLSLEATAGRDRTMPAGAAAQFVVVETSQGPALLSGGNRAPFDLRGVGEGLGPSRALGRTGLPGDLADPEALTLADGRIAVYGGLAGAQGIGAVILEQDGSLSEIETHPAPARSPGPITALAHARLDETDYLFATGSETPRLSVFSVGRDGGLTDRGGLSADNGLWVSRATTLSRLEAYGSEYLVLGAAGSSSISVVRATAGGALAVTDHLLDDRNSRFDGMSALATVTHRDRGYVISGGADDGISLHLLLPDGRLLALAHLADGTEMGLSDVSAIAARGAGNGIDIFVASASEPGLTRLRADLGPQGVIRIGERVDGTAGSDLLLAEGEAQLSAGAGDDILVDGPGLDRLRGGTGADIFVFGVDGETDLVLGFEPGLDCIDLSAWPMLRDISQLRAQRSGSDLRLTYGDETLILRSRNGQVPRLSDLSTATLIGATHLPILATSGFAGPPPETPLTPPRPVSSDRAARDRAAAEAEARAAAWAAEARAEAAAEARAVAETQNLRAAGPQANDKDGMEDQVQERPPRKRVSPAQPDPPEDTDAPKRKDGPRLSPDVATGDENAVGVQTGGRGADRLVGDGGADRIFGRGGDDRLLGGGGSDRLAGGSGDDRLLGQRGEDVLRGGRGSDVLKGGPQDDRLFGGPGADLLRGNPGDDRLLGQKGRDTLKGGSGHDLLKGGAKPDRLFGDKGRDRLDGGRGPDELTGGRGADVFVFRDGRDSITDFRPGAGDRIALDDRLWSGDLDAREVVGRFAARRGDDLVLDFGHGDRLLMESFDQTGGLADLIDIL